MGPLPPALNTRLVEDGSADAATLADRERGEPRREDPGLDDESHFLRHASAAVAACRRFRKSLSPTVANVRVPRG